MTSSRFERTKIGRRPTSSEPGPHSVGPATYPSKNKVVIKYETSSDTPNFSTINSVADAGADDAKVLNESLLSRSDCHAG